jgi:hypothetical protein
VGGRQEELSKRGLLHTQLHSYKKKAFEMKLPWRLLLGKL